MSETHKAEAPQLRQIVERIERTQSEKDDASEAQKQVYAEAKYRGYDTKVLRKVIARRKLEADARAELDAVTEMYENALEGK